MDGAQADSPGGQCQRKADTPASVGQDIGGKYKLPGRSTEKAAVVLKHFAALTRSFLEGRIHNGFRACDEMGFFRQLMRY